ncbi:hypothetical protein IV203_014098 [Nitzschia inconspicua]|uniref:Exostosin GT47 domain-containing protein n=1 Tax=Nitzschia inconspicua TaxID=303405 RepID=A0A9K3M7A4_9STRA|nr:hypothetical protein IV203_014286 [Nitzschia inconspicua]KAG7375003.1 hypothetical protein IV203_014098 [Nitzschia inconspicua]
MIPTADPTRQHTRSQPILSTAEILRIEMPPQPKFGKFRNESSWPYISQDIWYELVDNNQTFVIEYQGMEQWLLPWLDKAPWPVTILEINHDDRPFPSDILSDTVIQQILDHPNLKRFYAVNALWTNHTKLYPLPLGLKWFYSHRHPFSESKHDRVQQLSQWVGTTADDVKQSFLSRHRNRSSVWVRPSSDHPGVFYNKSMNAALSLPRNRLCFVLTAMAPHHTTCYSHNQQGGQTLNTSEYWQELQKHFFVASPAGRGIDTHATWEILLSGGVPIVPYSPLDPLFDNLPVWLVHDWAKEVNSSSIIQKATELIDRVDEFQFDKVFVKGWIEEIRKLAQGKGLPVWLVHDWAKEVNTSSITQKAKEFINRVDNFQFDKVFAKGWI